MNFNFVVAAVALTGLFGLAFDLFGVLQAHKQAGGKLGKRLPNDPSQHRLLK